MPSMVFLVTVRERLVLNIVSLLDKTEDGPASSEEEASGPRLRAIWFCFARSMRHMFDAAHRDQFRSRAGRFL